MAFALLPLLRLQFSNGARTVAERAICTVLLLPQKRPSDARSSSLALDALDYKFELEAGKALANKEPVGHSLSARRGAARALRRPVVAQPRTITLFRVWGHRMFKAAAPPAMHGAK